MRSAFRITDNPLSTQGCSCGSSFAPKELGQQEDKESGGSSRDKQDKDSNGGGGGKPYSLLFAASMVVMIKDFFTYRPNFEEDPITNKVKQAMLFRNRRNYDQALLILEEVLEAVKEAGDELPISRTYYEMALTHFMQGNLDKADDFFRLVVTRFALLIRHSACFCRLIQLHGKTDNSPEFIGISLKLADIFARRGDITNAEIGYRHCVSKQMAAMEKHLKKYLISKGATEEQVHKVEMYGSVYSDPLALFGMALEQFAHFLVSAPNYS